MHEVENTATKKGKYRPISVASIHLPHCPSNPLRAEFGACEVPLQESSPFSGSEVPSSAVSFQSAAKAKETSFIIRLSCD